VRSGSEIKKTYGVEEFPVDIMVEKGERGTGKTESEVNKLVVKLNGVEDVEEDGGSVATDDCDVESPPVVVVGGLKPWPVVEVLGMDASKLLDEEKLSDDDVEDVAAGSSATDERREKMVETPERGTSRSERNC